MRHCASWNASAYWEIISQLDAQVDEADRWQDELAEAKEAANETIHKQREISDKCSSTGDTVSEQTLS